MSTLLSLLAAARPRGPFSIGLCLIGLLCSATSRGSTPGGAAKPTLRAVWAEKTEIYHQWSDTSESFSTAYAYLDLMIDNGTASTSVTVTTPLGQQIVVPYVSDGYFSASERFSTRDDRDQTYPNGAYTISVSDGTTTQTVVCTVTNRPVSPTMLTNYGALQHLQAGSATVKWAPIALLSAASTLSRDFVSLGATHTGPDDVPFTSISVNPADASCSLVIASTAADLLGYLNYRHSDTSYADDKVTPVFSTSGFELHFALATSNANPGRLVNLAVRTQAGTGDQTLITGFVVAGGGSSPLPMLVRGDGPALAAYQVSGFLSDPLIKVFQGSTLVTQNDNWGGDATISTAGARLGASPIADTASRDAAVLTSLAPGAYTMHTTGATGGTGVALAELYDASDATAVTADSPRLANVSSRANVGTGDNILIVGFVVTGGPVRVMVRGLGPELTRFGVTGVLANPKLALLHGSTTLLENDDWAGDYVVKDTTSLVGAQAISSTTSHDAAFVVSLDPGAYTVQLSGVGGGTGVGLIEVYEVR